MKKIITICAAVLLTAVLAVTLCACGGNTNNNGTSGNSTSNTSMSDTMNGSDTMFDAENGKVSDVSEKGDNGVLGDIVTDISTDVSQAVTDVSEAITP